MCFLRQGKHKPKNVTTLNWKTFVQWRELLTTSSTKQMILVAQTVKTCLQCRRPRFDPWVGKLPCRNEWQPTPVFLPGEFHGQSSLVGGLQSMGLQRVRHDWVTNRHTQIYDKELLSKLCIEPIQLNIEKEKSPFKYGQRSSADLFPEKTHRWPTGTWKDAQHQHL